MFPLSFPFFKPAPAVVFSCEPSLFSVPSLRRVVLHRCPPCHVPFSLVLPFSFVLSLLPRSLPLSWLAPFRPFLPSFIPLLLSCIPIFIVGGRRYSATPVALTLPPSLFPFAFFPELTSRTRLGFTPPSVRWCLVGRCPGEGLWLLVAKLPA